MKWGRLCFFAGGVWFGTVGARILSGRSAKKVYSHCTAAVIRAKDAVVDQASVIQENCSDIYETAKQINKEKAARETEEMIDDTETPQRKENEPEE
ncbi:MAG: DUF6110 family protein [Lachnospiraceae bacterium]|nr:DUF6110 family protein [Lachnospiraceae bacterium]